MEKAGRDKRAMALHVKVLEARRRVMGNKAPEAEQSREVVNALQATAEAEAEAEAEAKAEAEARDSARAQADEKG
ncbi:MAG: hypothetical protein LBQ12_03635 [Deltaproteobacteria bacterium]|jgi:hypothetical protein|nr:hypothetical protein [Deltaproteobacteria bacterium]